MIVGDFSGEIEVEDERQLANALRRRHAGELNAFWLCDKQKERPALSILAKGDLAYLHYFPTEDHPGYASIGRAGGLASGETTDFCMALDEYPVPIQNNRIVPFHMAVKVAKEFLRSDELPKAIQWFEL
jgi:Immunity protein Imm1